MLIKGVEMIYKCDTKKPCFGNVEGYCTVLRGTYSPGKCPFQKGKATWTKGRYYPYNHNYAPGEVK